MPPPELLEQARALVARFDGVAGRMPSQLDTAAAPVLADVLPMFDLPQLPVDGETSQVDAKGRFAKASSSGFGRSWLATSSSTARRRRGPSTPPSRRSAARTRTGPASGRRGTCSPLPALRQPRPSPGEIAGLLCRNCGVDEAGVTWDPVTYRPYDLHELGATIADFGAFYDARRARLMARLKDLLRRPVHD